jgi:hypothetical protein
MSQKIGGEEEDCPPMRDGRSIQCTVKKKKFYLRQTTEVH